MNGPACASLSLPSVRVNHLKGSRRSNGSLFRVNWGKKNSEVKQSHERFSQSKASCLLILTVSSFICSSFHSPLGKNVYSKALSSCLLMLFMFPLPAFAVITFHDGKRGANIRRTTVLFLIPHKVSLRLCLCANWYLLPLVSSNKCHENKHSPTFDHAIKA